MTDNINVSYSYQIGSNAKSNGPAPTTGPDRRTYAYLDYEEIIINEKSVMIMNMHSRKKMVVTREVANALTYCNTFETLPDHAAKLCATIPVLRDQHADVLQILDHAKKSGILVGSEEIAARLSSGPTDTHIAPTRVFIITCDRPVAIERLLDSMLLAGSLGRHNQLFLIDDSRNESNARQNRQLVEKFNLSCSKSMLYFGAEAASSMLSQLVEALPAQERSMRFLLDRARWADQPTFGLSRNLCLLLSVGYRAIVLDDDILCRAVRSPVTTPGIGLNSDELREAWFYPSELAMWQQTELCDSDPLSMLADALGKPLASVMATQPGGTLKPAALDHCNGKMLSTLDGKSPVLITQCGSAGDPGTANPRWLARLGRESIERLLSNNTDIQTVPEGRPCWLGHTRPSISKVGVISQLTGLDNSRLLPPYAPVMRGEDELFGSMTAYLHPNSAVLNCDWAVPHLPIDDRSGKDSSTPFTAQIHLGTLAGYLRSRIDTRNFGSVESRLAALAAEFRGLGECADDTLLAHLEFELTGRCAETLKMLETRATESRDINHPGWQVFLKKFASETRSALMASSAFEDGNLPNSMSLVQDAAIEFSEALESWQTIRECSATIAEELISSGKLLP